MYTDINNKEQPTISVRWVDNELQQHENFLGFYEIPNIESGTIASAKKILSLDFGCRFLVAEESAMMMQALYLGGKMGW